MRIILISSRALVSTLCPCLFWPLVRGWKLGADGLERVDLYIKSWVKLLRLNSRDFGSQGIGIH
jgi:hypothetical protein